MAAKKKVRETPDTPPEPPSVADVCDTVRAIVTGAIEAGCDKNKLMESLVEIADREWDVEIDEDDGPEDSDGDPYDSHLR